MDTVFPYCAGLDVHKQSVMVCTHWRDGDGHRRQETRRFGTFTRDLLQLSDWLAGQKVTHVAMESTGVFWKPIYNILESGFEVLLVNAQHVKQVPGRKTDVKDCEWLADLLEHGLLRGSFIPSIELRQLRDLTRERAQLVNEHTRVANRIHKILEDANIKLGSVATDILGVSGRAMLGALIRGESDPLAMAELARGRLRDKIEALKVALEGKVLEHHRRLLAFHFHHLVGLEAQIEALNTWIEEQMGPFKKAAVPLASIPGVQQTVAEACIAEIGVNMDQFPSDDHLASWAGLAPGNNESAGKRRSGRSTKGNRWLRRVLCQAAWAAAHTKDTFLCEIYKRLARRRGKKRAIVALARKILKIIYHILATGQPYVELGAHYVIKRDAERRLKSALVQLDQLGYEAVLVPQGAHP